MAAAGTSAALKGQAYLAHYIGTGMSGPGHGDLLFAVHARQQLVHSQFDLSTHHTEHSQDILLRGVSLGAGRPARVD